MLLQDVCQLKSGWDNDVSDELQTRWMKILRTALELSNIKISRHYLVNRNLDEVKNMELQVQRHTLRLLIYVLFSLTGISRVDL